jgi:hypothetical protein
MTAFVLTTSADVGEVVLREGGAAGTIKVRLKCGVVQDSRTFTFGDRGVLSQSGNWYVDLIGGTTPQMTIIGD